MVIFNELIKKINKAKSYQVDGEKLTKKSFGEFISINYDEAVESLMAKELTKALSFDKKALAILNNKDLSPSRAVFNLQYYYNKELPFSFKGYVFANLLSLGDAYFNDTLDEDEISEILANHLVSDYVAIKGNGKMSKKTLNAISLAENLVANNKKAAAALLAYVLGNKKTYTYNKKEFATLEELYNYLSDSYDFKAFADRYDNDKYLMGWLYYLGNKDLIEKYNELIKHFEK